MKILVVTDSLGLPRMTPEALKPEQTWVSLLKRQFEVVQFSFGGATISDLYKQVEYMKMYQPEVTLIQSGIVDCAPRALSRFENEFINKFRFTRMLSSRLLHKRRITRMREKRNVTYTLPAEFENLVRKFDSAFPTVFWVEIAPTNKDYEKLVPGISRNVDKFNAIIHAIAGDRVISLRDFTADDIMSDHIHLSATGNKKLFEKVSTLLTAKK